MALSMIKVCRPNNYNETQHYITKPWAFVFMPNLKSELKHRNLHTKTKTLSSLKKLQIELLWSSSMISQFHLKLNV